MKTLLLSLLLVTSHSSFAAISNLEAAEFALGFDKVKEKIKSRTKENQGSAEAIEFFRHEGAVKVEIYFSECMIDVIIRENKDRSLKASNIRTSCE